MVGSTGQICVISDVNRLLKTEVFPFNAWQTIEILQRPPSAVTCRACGKTGTGPGIVFELPVLAGPLDVAFQTACIEGYLRQIHLGAGVVGNPNPRQNKSATGILLLRYRLKQSQQPTQCLNLSKRYIQCWGYKLEPCYCLEERSAGQRGRVFLGSKARQMKSLPPLNIVRTSHEERDGQTTLLIPNKHRRTESWTESARDVVSLEAQRCNGFVA